MAAQPTNTRCRCATRWNCSTAILVQNSWLLHRSKTCRRSAQAKLEYRRRHLVVDCLNTKLPKSLNVVLHGLSRRLPVYRGERTFAGWAGMSQRCQQQSWHASRVGSDGRRGERHRCCVSAVITPKNEAASARSELRQRFSRHKLTGRKLKALVNFPLPRSGPSARELWSGERRRARHRR